DSTFGPLLLDDTFRGLLTLTMPSTLASIRLMLAGISSPRKFDRRETVGFIVRGLLDGPLPDRRTAHSLSAPASSRRWLGSSLLASKIVRAQKRKWATHRSRANITPKSSDKVAKRLPLPMHPTVFRCQMK